MLQKKKQPSVAVEGMESGVRPLEKERAKSFERSFLSSENRETKEF